MAVALAPSHRSSLPSSSLCAPSLYPPPSNASALSCSLGTAGFGGCQMSLSPMVLRDMRVPCAEGGPGACCGMGTQEAGGEWDLGPHHACGGRNPNQKSDGTK